MQDHQFWMQRCLQLALNGAGIVEPNPMVGCILVLGDTLLAEGWHHAFGKPHAEVECLSAFGNDTIPEDAILYVNLEPCAHHGKTPPCADLLIKRGIKHVVIGQRDPFPAVSGKGIQRLLEAGIEVTEGVDELHCRWQQRRFLTSVEQRRPYVILKWARSADGFMDQHPRTERTVERISGDATNVLVHKWRSEEQAILVGSRTVLNDDPQLTTRLVNGRSPVRMVLDRTGKTPADSKVYDGSASTLLFTGQRRADLAIEQHVISNNESPIEQILKFIHERSFRSILVEGGAELLNHFLDRGHWDEARVITGKPILGQGTKAPELNVQAIRSFRVEEDPITFHINPNSPSIKNVLPRAEWYW